MRLASHKGAGASLPKQVAASSTNQGDLFQRLEAPAAPAVDLDIHFELLGALTHAIREAKARGLSRARIVDAMNRLLPDLEDPVTERQLNAWTAASKEHHHFPARYLAAFCAATECDLPLRTLANALGLDLVDGREAAAKRLGESLVQSARLKREQRELTRSLGS